MQNQSGGYIQWRDPTLEYRTKIREETQETDRKAR